MPPCRLGRCSEGDGRDPSKCHCSGSLDTAGVFTTYQCYADDCSVLVPEKVSVLHFIQDTSREIRSAQYFVFTSARWGDNVSLTLLEVLIIFGWFWDHGIGLTSLYIIGNSIFLADILSKQTSSSQKMVSLSQSS